MTGRRLYEMMMGVWGIIIIASALVMLAFGGVLVFAGTTMLAMGRRVRKEDRS